LNEHTPTALDIAAAELGTPTLRAIYQEIVDALAAKPEAVYALRLLEFVAVVVTFDDDVPSQLLERSMRQVISGGAQVEALSSTIYSGAVRMLRRYRLIDVFVTEIDGRTVQLISMHELTRELLRSVFGTRLVERCNQVIAASAWNDPSLDAFWTVARTAELA